LIAARRAASKPNRNAAPNIFWTPIAAATATATAPDKAFEPSLHVWATVMSRPAEDRAIVDAGLKALAFDSGPPQGRRSVAYITLLLGRFLTRQCPSMVT